MAEVVGLFIVLWAFLASTIAAGVYVGLRIFDRRVDEHGFRKR